MDKQIIDPRTIKAIDILLGLFTDQEKKLLSIKRGDKIIELVQLFVARWINHIPITDVPLAFEAQAAQVIEANKGWIQLILKLKEDDLFSKLADPENYKEKIRKFTLSKSTYKTHVLTESENSNVVRSIGRTIGGDGGVNRSYDYSGEWDRADRERLDKMIMEKVKVKTTGETGEEDDSRGTQQEEEERNKEWLNQVERIERLNIEKSSITSMIPKFSDDYREVDERKLKIFDATMNQSTNATIGQVINGGLSFTDSLRRQNFDTLREKLILAEAINNIHNIEFIDIREKIFKKLDALFVYRKKVCL